MHGWGELIGADYVLQTLGGGRSLQPEQGNGPSGHQDGDMVPFQIRNFRLNRASGEDIAWLCSTLNRESKRFGSRVELDETGSLRLEWS